MRADLILSLSGAALENDADGVRRAIFAIANEESRKGHSNVSSRLNGMLEAGEFSVNRRPRTVATIIPPPSNPVPEVPTKKLADVQLSKTTAEVVAELVEEQRSADFLRSYGLEPRHKLLLTGPPGTGKTSLARAIAGELGIPMITVQYEEVIGSYLGETSSRLHELFQRASTGTSVLFLDEFDTLAKERGDSHDTGEVKRVVSTLLLQIDALPSHVLVIAATNHPELLDRAAWRRFQITVELPLPTESEREGFAEMTALKVGLRERAGIEEARLLQGGSYAEIEEVILARRRQELLRSRTD